MKELVAVGAIVLSYVLFPLVSGQNCQLAQDALMASQRKGQAESLNQNDLFPELYNSFVTANDPAIGSSLEVIHPQLYWNAFQKATIVLRAVEFINQNVSTGTKCEDLRPYTNCFQSSEICYDLDDSQCDTSALYREPGGKCNNLKNSKLGTKYAAYGRLIPSTYYDCVHKERRTYMRNEELPSPRHIGNILTELGYAALWPPVQSVLNIFAGFFAQIITHDVGSKVNVQRKNAVGPGIDCCASGRRVSDDILHSACQPMDVPGDDNFYSEFNQRCLNFVSSQVIFSNENCKIGPAEQTNSVSSFLDLTIVYGDDKATENRLRSRKDGQILTNAKNVLPERSPCSQSPCYFLGDGRLIQTPMLAQLHSLLLRLHNLIGPQISSDDEIAYQEAKRLTIALYQHLIYNDWLPIALGSDESKEYRLTCDTTKGNCGKYNPNVDPSTTNCFAQGAFRVFHKAMPSKINLYGRDQKIKMSHPFSDMNSTRMIDLEERYDDLVRGQIFDPLFFGGFSNELRNLFAKNPSGMGVDLHSIDIKRARNHGVPSFVDYIPYCTNRLARISSWSDLYPYFNRDSLETLQTVYESPKDIDLLVGLIGERRNDRYAMFGKIGSCIVAEQFKRYKFGDRFFYQWTDGLYPFTQRQLREIDRFTPATFLCLVTDVESVPQNAFLTPSRTNPMVRCDSIPKFNFALFSKHTTE
ncbi:peroxidase-like [Bradysia coprophila]|uniref:peroxidase-like n=1 Tax=Bradysia coprophila TaxID=38358 RepID=UPI00187D9EBA|nr:peroxidase-like [Bradysia coprophila]